MCWDCNKRFNLTSGLESAGLEDHHNVILKSNFESKSKQDLCVGIVTRGSI